MKAKYKMTGCARFLIFLVILIPIAYFGSKYLRDSGTWDKIKDKVENRDSNSVERSIENRNERISPTSIEDLTNDERYGRLRQAYEEQEALIKKQEETIADLQKQIDELKQAQSSTRNDRINIPPPTRQDDRPSSTSTSEGTPSLDDLLREADIGSSGTTNPSPSTNANRRSLGIWSFNYSGANGEIEMYEQNGKVMSRITVSGDNRVTIDELSLSGDRLVVNGSPTGEYYILKSNGDLDAFDQNGFQTTCRRIK